MADETPHLEVPEDFVIDVEEDDGPAVADLREAWPDATPVTLKGCLQGILDAIESDDPMMHEIAWFSTVRLGTVLRGVLDLVPLALRRALEESEKAGGAVSVEMPDEFHERLMRIRGKMAAMSLASLLLRQHHGHDLFDQSCCAYGIVSKTRCESYRN